MEGLVKAVGAHAVDPADFSDQPADSQIKFDRFQQAALWTPSAGTARWFHKSRASWSENWPALKLTSFQLRYTI